MKLKSFSFPIRVINELTGENTNYAISLTPDDMEHIKCISSNLHEVIRHIYGSDKLTLETGKSDLCLDYESEV